MKIQSYRFLRFLNNFLIYFLLSAFALVMIFPFLYMLATSFKIPADTFRYPPRMLPRDPVTLVVTGSGVAANPGGPGIRPDPTDPEPRPSAREGARGRARTCTASARRF